MQLIHTLEEFPRCKPPIALTIGFFDGVHRGHQELFSRLCDLGTSVCFTFENHPLSILRPDTLRPLLTRPQQRYKLIADCGVQIIIALPFTHAFANQQPREFLTHLRSHIHFDHLLLGHDAHLGKDRSGSPAHLEPLAAEMGFTLEYLDTISINDAPVSSSRIRQAIEEGNLPLVKALLGRHLSYTGTVIRGSGVGKRIGYHTANLDLEGLCLPPDGVYAVTLDSYRGVANLGTAPTLQTSRKRLLEVHLLDTDAELYGLDVEVSLHAFLRAEQKFPSPEALRTQIAKDINRARDVLAT